MSRVSMLRACLALIVAASPAGAARSAELAPLPLDNPATGMAMTEDGAFVLIAHENDDQITVWDVKAGKAAKTVKCPKPKYILCRGNNAFVINAGKSTISILDSTKDWSLVNEVASGDPDGYCLSAPGGKNYKGALLVTAGGYGKRKVLLVDVAKDSVKQVHTAIYMSVATFSYDGTAIIQQGEFGHSPAGKVESFGADTYLSAERTRPSGMGEHESTPFLQQLCQSSLWVGRDGLFAGIPPKRFGTRINGALFPDYVRQVYYVLEGTKLTTYKFSASATELGSCQLGISPQYPKNEPGPEKLCLPAAATHDGIAHLFQFVAGKQLVFHCRVEASGGGAGPVAGGAPAAGADNFPPRIIAGKPLSFPLLDKEGAGTFTVVNGPKGLSVSDKGVLAWIPGAADVGPHQIKIKAEIGGQVSFLRLSTEVISGEVAALVGGDLSKLADLGVHYLLTDKYDLAVGADGKSMLLLAGRKLDLLDADGLIVRKSLELKAAYLRIAERAGYYVALASDSLDLLDKNTLEARKRIALPGSGASDMALHPARRETYVAVTDNNGGKLNRIEAKRIAVAGEDAGSVQFLPRVLGQWLVIHPGGRYLFTGLHDMYEDGYRIDWNVGMVMPDYGNIDLVVSYDLSGANISHRQTNLAPGANGRALRISPDGAHVSYVSGGGYRSGTERLNGYTIPAFTADDIRVAKVAYNTDPYPIDISYHPTLNLVIACSEKEVRIFDRRSGDILANKLDLGDAKLSGIQRVFFSPGGRHALIDSRDKTGRRALRAFGLKLTDEEKKQLGVPAPIAPVAPGEPHPGGAEKPAAQPREGKPVPLGDLEALTGAGGGPMDTKQIAKAFTDAVVIVTSEGGSGTGFVVGSKGYVLTCAHVIPMLGDPEVSFRESRGGAAAMKTVKAAVVRMDQKRDLALLKIDAPAALPTVRLETSGRLEMGEQVSVIGHPGLGAKILEYTMTQGIVSNPQRKIEDQDFVQTSAAINPGSSGSPMFNSKGNVVGLAVLKAAIENTGFAVPVEHLAAFLKSCAGGSSAPAPDAGRSPDQICASWMAMAENFMKNGVNDKAREYLQKIIDAYPNSAQAAKAREMLKGL